MKFAQILLKNSGEIHHAVIKQDRLHVIQGNLFSEWKETGRTFNWDEVVLLAPLKPSMIIGVGKNYVAPGEPKPEKLPEIPVFFYKPLTSVVGPEAEIVIPSTLNEVKFEAELAVIIGREARNISEAVALDYVFGYTVANDVTAPQYFHPDGHWTLAKSFDTFTPLGPFIETELDPFKVQIQAIKNGELMQNSSTELMILSIPFMLSYLSRVMTLQPGDVLLSGSPVGADFIRRGDTIECRVDEIGTLRNFVVNAS